MTTVAVPHPHSTFRARVNAYPLPLFLIGALILAAPLLHPPHDGYAGTDVVSLPRLGDINSWRDNFCWLAAIVVVASVSVVLYRKHGVLLRGMAFTMAGALAVYILVAVLPGASWHWRYLGLIGLAAVVWGLVIAERSAWLGVVATVFTVVSVLSGTTDSGFYASMDLFDGVGPTTTELCDVLLPSLVLLVGAAIGLLARKVSVDPTADRDAHMLLEDLSRLRKPADARRWAPPLLLFGVLIAVAPALYLPVQYDMYRMDDQWQPELVYGFGGTGRGFAHPGLIALYWLGVLAVGIGFAVWWYRARAARLGVELDTRGQLVAAGAVLVGIIVWAPVLYSINYGYLATESYTIFTLLVVSAAAAVGLLSWATRSPRWPLQRFVGLAAGWLFATMAATMLAMYVREYWALLAIAAVVLAMAWVERSRLLNVVAAAFTVAVVLIWITQNSLFRMIGWGADGRPQLDVLQDMILPSAVLLIGGIVGLAKARKPLMAEVR